ncbi:hypothetical protein P170DRAFT_509935 [Aspergillus steynii IBT 23096]|uniref:Uncharacterized protein n=1 Tax=Aspergillus steynii IBT 23096 TaxID=1392250 RepID=A0A2I2G931_9EURO|nr:uncharacterized protein P170DRAFT_509935 [Aspergillus steynii IBT 23096]PLB49384.1 hypothetical protein P170DRAFT_509935 [Aspergillus steynii IBT 23096]
MGQISVPAQARSRLERLPVEIIQEIFLHSLEFNFPRVSRFISGILSNTVIYTWLIRLAFSSTNESSKRGLFTPDFLPAPLDFWALSTEERRDLQTDILGCGWCTLPLIRKCQREYVEQVLRHQLHSLEFCAEDLPTLADLGRHFENPQEWETGGELRGKGDLILRAHDRITHQEERVAIWFHYGAVQVRRPNRLYTHNDIFQLPDCSAVCPPRMPDKLLCPPWTETKLEFLQLFSTTAYIDEDSSLSRSRRVLRQLIRDRDLATFERVLQMRVLAQDYKYPQHWPVPVIVFRAALKHADERDDPFIKVLVNQCWEEIPDDDLQLKHQLMTKAGLSSVG